jgi:ATP synthase protein I
MNRDEKLRRRIELQAQRMKQAEKERPTLLAQTTYMGTLGLLFVLPVVAGAYLGSWLDSQAPGYSVRWTVSLLFLGIVLGAMNVYLFIRERT